MSESPDVLVFRGHMLTSWPELGESIELYEEDPEFDPRNLSKYVVINIHAGTGLLSHLSWERRWTSHVQLGWA